MNNPLIKKGTKVNLQLEALRGFAALFVVLGHIIYYHKILNNNYFPKKLVFIFNWPTGHLSVLIFFILSGYVIAESNKTKIKANTITAYLKKRLLRLYPIYIVSLLFALLVATNHYSWPTILSNFTFTQGLIKDVIWENGPIWSLNYELLYYILFIPVSMLNINPLLVWLSALAIAILNNHLNPGIPIITSYFYGFSFWSVGLCISKYLNKREGKISYNKLVSTLIYISSLTFILSKSRLILYAYAVLDKITVGYPANAYWSAIMIRSHDLILLPYCFCFVMIFAGNNFKYKNHLIIILQFPALLGVYHILRAGHNNLLPIVSVIYYLMAVALYLTDIKFLNIISQYIIKTGTWLGGISYGIYVIHFPILIAFGRYDIFSAYNTTTYVIKVVLFLLTVIVTSYILEKMYQPFVKSWVYKTKKQPSILIT
jgi:peptidoglycan/LPS O-acetylase OafA/YrhL